MDTLSSQQALSTRQCLVLIRSRHSVPSEPASDAQALTVLKVEGIDDRKTLEVWDWELGLVFLLNHLLYSSRTWGWRRHEERGRSQMQEVRFAGMSPGSRGRRGQAGQKLCTWRLSRQ